MNIHIVYACNPRKFAGGVSKMVLDLACVQSALADVEIWTVDSGNASVEDINPRLKIRRFPGQYRFGVCGSIEMVQEIQRSRKRISVLHGHNTFHPLNLQIGKIASQSKLPVFFHPHGAIDRPLIKGHKPRQLKKKLYLRFREIPLLNSATGVFALTPLEKQQLQLFGVTSPIHVLPNGVDTGNLDDSVVNPTNFSYDPNADRFNVLWVGRIDPKKGLHDLLPAFSKLLKKFPNGILQLAGNMDQNPTYTERLKSIATKLRIEDRIQWLGFVDEAGKKDLFAGANIFVHASFSEGMAMSILESMARGVPVVATKGCYFSDAANAEAIIECDQGPDAIFEGLSAILRRPDRGLGIARQAVNYLRDSHSWTEIAKEMLTIYQSV